MTPALGEPILILALVAFLALAVFFIFCRNYEDGLVGNLALGLMALACILILRDAWRGDFDVPAPEYCLLIVCNAVFMLRHAWRFALFHWHGHFGWQPPRDMRRAKRAPGGPDDTLPFSGAR